MEKTLSEFRPLSEIDLQTIRSREWPALDLPPQGAAFLQPLFKIEEFTVGDKTYRTLLVALTSDKKGEKLTGYVQAASLCAKVDETVTVEGSKIEFLIPFVPQWIGHNSLKYEAVMQFVEANKGLKVTVETVLVRSQQGRVHPLNYVKRA